MMPIRRGARRGRKGERPGRRSSQAQRSAAPEPIPLSVGVNDAFERRYTANFRERAAPYGEFVEYEKDRAGRDIGIHFTRPVQGGGERVTGTLRWFQLKGVSSSVLSRERFQALQTLPLSLEVKHLRFWFALPDPTYLVVYIEAVDQFLVLDIQRYVVKHWGKGILSLRQATVTVHVDVASTLDDEAFQQMLARGDAEQWERLVGMSRDEARLAVRDAGLAERIRRVKKAGGWTRLTVTRWLTKMRGEALFESVSSTGRTEVLRNHWEYLMDIDGIEKSLPHLSLSPGEPETHFFDLDEDDDSDGIALSNGDVVRGTELAGEVIRYVFRVELNELGERIANWARELARAGVVNLNRDRSEFLSVAPWHKRNV
jgi:hypothetical protein